MKNSENKIIQKEIEAAYAMHEVACLSDETNEYSVMLQGLIEKSNQIKHMQKKNNYQIEQIIDGCAVSTINKDNASDVKVNQLCAMYYLDGFKEAIESLNATRINDIYYCMDVLDMKIDGLERKVEELTKQAEDDYCYAVMHKEFLQEEFCDIYSILFDTKRLLTELKEIQTHSEKQWSSLNYNYNDVEQYVLFMTHLQVAIDNLTSSVSSIERELEELILPLREAIDNMRIMSRRVMLK